jgi:hypothetical protein
MTAPVAYNQEKSCLSGTVIKKDLSVMVVCSFIVSKAANGGKNKNTVASSDPKSHSPQENIWVWLRQTQEKIARMGDNSNLSPVLEHFYRNARTHFSKNQQIKTDVGWKKEDNLRNQPRR